MIKQGEYRTLKGIKVGDSIGFRHCPVRTVRRSSRSLGYEIPAQTLPVFDPKSAVEAWREIVRIDGTGVGRVLHFSDGSEEQVCGVATKFRVLVAK